jgi:hypothetical protein
VDHREDRRHRRQCVAPGRFRPGGVGRTRVCRDPGRGGSRNTRRCLPSRHGIKHVVQITFAYNHGDYAAEIDTNWLGIAGPRVKNLHLDGTAASKGPNSAGPDSGQVTVPGSHTTGTWIDETDIRPTIIYLTGLKDDYEHDGRVITQILTHPNSALSAKGVTALGECYKQLNSSVGEFGTATLQAATKGIESNSNATYKATDKALRNLDVARDNLAGHIKGDLEAAAFENTPVPNPRSLTSACRKQVSAAKHLAGS